MSTKCPLYPNIRHFWTRSGLRISAISELMHAAICDLHDLIAALWNDSSLAVSRRSRKLAFVFDCHPMASVSGMTENTTSSGRGGLDALLMPLINGFMAARVVHVAAELGIADLLAASAESTETLASETGANILALHQLLRALASLGVIDELEPGRFALNAMGEQLRTGAPGSVRNLALSFGSERAWRSWGELRHSILTGTPAFRHVFGVDAFEYLASDTQTGCGIQRSHG